MSKKAKVYDSKSVSIYIIDAFSSVPFAGNPAGVCLDETDEGLEAGTMQKIAAETNLPDTAFVKRLNTNDSFEQSNKFGLRWFTTTMEIPMCGHATLGSAAVLFNLLGNKSLEIQFETKSGILIAKKMDGKIGLDLPTSEALPVERHDVAELVKEVVGDMEVCDLQLTPGGFPGLIIRLADKYTHAEIASLKPPIENFTSVHTAVPVQGVILTVKGSADTGCVDAQGHVFDCVSRFFAPWLGIKEDAVCGAAHAALAPYWYTKLDKANLYARQCSSRGGELWLSLKEGGRLDVSGYATVVMEGKLHYK